MTIKKITSISLLAFFLVLFTGGILIQFLNPEMFKNTEWTPPVFILVASLLCIINQKKRTVVLLILAGLIGFFSEITENHRIKNKKITQNFTNKNQENVL